MRVPAADCMQGQAAVCMQVQAAVSTRGQAGACMPDRAVECTRAQAGGYTLGRAEGFIVARVGAMYYRSSRRFLVNAKLPESQMTWFEHLSANTSSSARA